MTVCTTLIVDYFHEEKQRNKYLGLQTVATTLAATVFIILGGALGVGGWHTPFWVYAISLVIAVPMIFLLWEPGRGDATDAHVASAGRVPVPWRQLRLPLVVALFGGFTFYVMLIETSYLLVENGVDAADTATIGAVAAGASLVTAAGAFSFPRLARRGHRFVLPLAFGLQAAGMIVIWVAGGVPGVVAGAIIAGFGSGVLLPSMLTWALSGIRFEERGRATGWWNAAFFFGQFLTPLLIGALVAAVGGLPFAVGIVGVACALVALLLGLRLRRSAARRWRTRSPRPDRTVRRGIRGDRGVRMPRRRDGSHKIRLRAHPACAGVRGDSRLAEVVPAESIPDMAIGCKRGRVPWQLRPATPEAGNAVAPGDQARLTRSIANPLSIRSDDAHIPLLSMILHQLFGASTRSVANAPASAGVRRCLRLRRGCCARSRRRARGVGPQSSR